MSVSLRFVILVVFVAVFTACGSSDESDSSRTDANSSANGPSVVADTAYTTTEAGFRYVDLTDGEGAEATSGDEVSVHYTGWLASDSTTFDSSRDRGEPFAFTLGAGDVIEGWDRGVQGMKVGGTRQLVLPPDLAYGSRGAGGGTIPPNATLIFEVELLNVERP